MSNELIYKTDAVDAINNIMPTKEGFIEPEEAVEVLRNLPPVEPKQPDSGSASCISDEKMHDRTTDGLISRQAASDARRYTFGNDEFSLEAAYHDCKLVFDGITDDDSFQEADTGLILYYANEIIYALQEALEGKDTNVHTNDYISRQAAIDTLKGLPTWWADEGGYYGGAQPPMVALLDPEDAVSAIENLSSEQYEREYTMEEFMFGQDMGNPEDGSL